MTIFLILHTSASSLLFESDDMDKIEILSDFFKKDLGAFHSTDEPNEFFIDALSEEQSKNLNSLLSALRLS